MTPLSATVSLSSKTLPLSTEQSAQADFQGFLDSRSIHHLSGINFKYLQNAEKAGPLSVKASEAFFKQVEDLTVSKIDELSKIAEKLRLQLEAFICTAQEVDEKFIEHTAKVMAEKSKEVVLDSMLQKFILRNKIDTAVKEVVATTVRIHQELIDIQLDLIAQGMKGIIDVASDKRNKGIKMLEASLDGYSYSTKF
ncbi:hypothetical protein [Neochlamydia sp. S13]|uniref:hypothetical protein n=1 Tax=Neochlamydia sp. S13 TaxID=1353976 RepID=UPI0005A7AAFB|nr:hypothetical protein [Neochlamydia sp. S13]BBI17619.1 hypothetical protein NCS13_1_1424 [Neochlamydia sp. S13]